MQRTKAELTAKTINVIYQNNSEAITGAVAQDLFLDYIDSFSIQSEPIGTTGTSLINQFHTNITPVSTNLNCIIQYKPINAVNVFINGVKYAIGNTINSILYFKDPVSNIVRTSTDIRIGDVLHYNSGLLLFSIDIVDVIEINYITVT